MEEGELLPSSPEPEEGPPPPPPPPPAALCPPPPPPRGEEITAEQWALSHHADKASRSSSHNRYGVHKAISEKADKKDQQQLHHHGHRKEDVVHRRTEPATKEGEHSSRGAEDRKRSRNRSKERMEKRHKERDHGEDPQQSVRGQASRSDSAQTVPRPTTGHEKKKRKEKLQLSPEKLTASLHPQYEASRQLGQGGPTTISPKKENLPLPSQPPRPPSQLPSHPPQLPSQPPPLPSQPLKLSSQPPPLPSQPLKLPSQPPQLFAALKASLSDDEGELFEEEPVRY